MKHATTADKMKDVITISDLCGMAVKSTLMLKLIVDGKCAPDDAALKEHIADATPMLEKLLMNRTLHALTPDCPASHASGHASGTKAPCAEFLIPLEDDTQLHVMTGIETWNRLTQLLTDAMVALPADVSKGGFTYEGEA
jgi:hypothetical protein